MAKYFRKFERKGGNSLEFYEIIRGLRDDLLRKSNQTEIAEKLGMTQRKLSYIETGKSEPSLADLRSICRFYNISADYILGLTTEPKKLKTPEELAEEAEKENNDKSESDLDVAR